MIDGRAASGDGGSLRPVAGMKLLVSSDELAKLVSLSRPTIDRLVRDSRIPSITVGRRRLFDPNDVVEALKSES